MSTFKQRYEELKAKPDHAKGWALLRELAGANGEARFADGSAIRGYVSSVEAETGDPNDVSLAARTLLLKAIGDQVEVYENLTDS
jgi:hypothetical protein